jgi:hypothetical protein
MGNTSWVNLSARTNAPGINATTLRRSIERAIGAMQEAEIESAVEGEAESMVVREAIATLHAVLDAAGAPPAAGSEQTSNGELGGNGE